MSKKTDTKSVKSNSVAKSCPALRIAGYVVFAVLVLFLAAGLSLSVLQADPDATVFGIRYQTVTDTDNTVIAPGSLVFIDVDAEYVPEQAVSYEYTDEQFLPALGISTAAYLQEGSYNRIIGAVVGSVPVLGSILGAIAFNTVVAAVMTIVAALILALLLTVGNKKGGRVKVQQRKRISIQTLWFIITNSYMIGYVQGNIYQGSLKNICVPGLNCYSCPGAWGACPIGALQAVFTKRSYASGTPTPEHYFPFYVVGFLMAVGAICGRLVCGFLCPFGWIQELLHKIPLPKKLKINTFPGDKLLRYLKYVILVVFVIAMPLFVESVFPWFCKLICPSGMAIGGIPLMSVNDELRSAAGSFTILKLAILAFIVILSIAIYRPFCKYLCPLGAIYGVLNPISFYKYSVDESKCTNCGLCVRTCRMGIDIRKTPNSIECIRCGDCRASCPTGAIHSGFKRLPARIKNEDLTIN